MTKHASFKIDWHFQLKVFVTTLLLCSIFVSYVLYSSYSSMSFELKYQDFLDRLKIAIEDGGIDFESYFKDFENGNGSPFNNGHMLNGISTKYYDFSNLESDEIQLTGFNIYFPNKLYSVEMDILYPTPSHVTVVTDASPNTTLPLFKSEAWHNYNIREIYVDLTDSLFEIKYQKTHEKTLE